MAPVLPTRTFTDALLDPYRRAGDAPADALVAQIAAAEGRPGILQLLRFSADLSALTTQSQSEAVQQFFRQYGHLSALADPVLMEKGVAFFWKHHESIATVLACYSLPYCYAAANGAQVLYLSARIKNDTVKRLEETGEFIFSIMQERDWRNGRNLVKVLKIRLMHAVLRYFTRHAPQWNEAWGTPVNQEDMAGTNLAFSYVVIRGLRKSGVMASEADEEAYLHFWNVTGALLGVAEELLPRNLREAYHIDRAIAKRQFKPSEAGQALTRALLKALQQQVPAPALRDFPVAQMRYLLGVDIADLLAVPRVPSEEKIIKFNALFPVFRWGMPAHRAASPILEKYRR